MMPPAELRTFLRAVPFRPFRIQMASGRSFEIRHPEMAVVGRMTMVVFSAVQDGSRTHEQRHYISMLLIECVEEILGATG